MYWHQSVKSGHIAITLSLALQDCMKRNRADRVVKVRPQRSQYCAGWLIQNFHLFRLPSFSFFSFLEARIARTPHPDTSVNKQLNAPPLQQHRNISSLSLDIPSVGVIIHYVQLYTHCTVRFDLGGSLSWPTFHICIITLDCILALMSVRFG